MNVYKIRYYHRGLFAELLPTFFPDGIKIVTAETAEKAIDKFYETHSENKYEIYDIKGVR